MLKSNLPIVEPDRSVATTGPVEVTGKKKRELRITRDYSYYVPGIGNCSLM